MAMQRSNIVPIDTLPHGIRPLDVISQTIPTGETIVDMVLWGEPSNRDSGWLWGITEEGAIITYNTSDNSTNIIRSYSAWVDSLLNTTLSNCRNNPKTIANIVGPTNIHYEAGIVKKPIFNTCDIYDQNGNILYPANCTLADFGIIT